MDFQTPEVDMTDNVLDRLALLRAGNQLLQFRLLRGRHFAEINLQRLATEHMRDELLDRALRVPATRRRQPRFRLFNEVIHFKSPGEVTRPTNLTRETVGSVTPPGEKLKADFMTSRRPYSSLK